ncbi:ATP-binding protein [Candidatus Uhrbacteria bacterium]|nr:ATP-binding protein [Candidatus Uhrbacteria bacterium]
MQYITRDAELILAKFLATNKVLLVLGARQVGKTTLLEHELIKDQSVFLNLDIEIDKAQLTARAALAPPDALKSLGSPKVLVVDEAQRFPEIGQLVKGWYDTKLPVKIILLGSSSVNLMDKIAEALTGRNEKLYLPPLTFREVARAQSWYKSPYTKTILLQNFGRQLQAVMREALVFGSYPETIAVAEARAQYLLNLASDYVLKDVLQLGLVKSPDTIRRLLLLLAHQIGAEVSITELAQNLHLARQTVTHYLDLLERSFVIFRLPAFSTNQRKEIAKNSKIYFWDTGVRNALLKEFSISELRADIGALWENWVVAEFAKQNLLAGGMDTLYFWRTTAGSEVDLVIKRKGALRAFEISWSKKKRTPLTFTRLYKIPVAMITRDSFGEYFL